MISRTMTAMLLSMLIYASAVAQNIENADTIININDNVKPVAKASRLTLGGYGEAVMTANMFSQHFNRYKQPARYADDRGHGRFDLPHVCFNLGYDFGHGWTFGTEVEFEHGGVGSAVEIEAEESGEYEAETEKGGEVVLEQMWINKAFAGGRFNIKTGEIVVPVGYTNAHHEPINFFTCYRPEGEMTILPCTWHQLGVSLWGRVGAWRYEAQLLSGLNSESFTAENFVHYGATSPYEFKVANSLATAVRVDNYSLKGLRVGVSGYYGHTFNNTLKYAGDSYSDVKGALSIASLDFTLNRWNWIVRGNAVYAHLSDADAISAYNKANSTHHKYQDGNPYHNTNIASDALTYSIEAGYDIFSQIPRMRKSRQQFYLFGRYEYYDSMYRGTYRSQYRYAEKYRYAVGVNYLPIKEVIVKGEYSKRLFRKPDNNGLAADSPLYIQPYNNEPSVSVSVAFCGWFR